MDIWGQSRSAWKTGDDDFQYSMLDLDDVIMAQGRKMINIHNVLRVYEVVHVLA